jgi:hypothetical protein
MQCGIEVVDTTADVERFDLRLPQEMRGRFSEFGNRTRVETRTSRRPEARSAGRILLDFSSSFVRYLVDLVTSAEFGGLYGAGRAKGVERILAGMIVHYQNEQGDPRGSELLVGVRKQDGTTGIDNRAIRPLFDEVVAGATRQPDDRWARMAALEAVFDRIEVRAGESATAYRHIRGIFPLAILEQVRDSLPGEGKSDRASPLPTVVSHDSGVSV